MANNTVDPGNENAYHGANNLLDFPLEVATIPELTMKKVRTAPLGLFRCRKLWKIKITSENFWGKLMSA